MTEKFAIISDIHGNYAALVEVLEDAKSRGIDQFIIAGDYCLSGAWPNDCVRAMKEIQKKWIIRGNEEIYLENLIGKDQSTWTDGQMQISYWNFRNIEKENLDYLLALPHTVEFERNGVKVHVEHSSKAFLGEYEFVHFSSMVLAKKYENAEVTAEILRDDVRKDLEGDLGFQKKIEELEEGVYIFGHSHVQWSYKDSNKNILLSNPGSCGLPLDAIKNSVPYSILTITENGDTSLEEIRVLFSMADYIEKLKKTTQYVEANVWSKVIFKELLSAREHMMFFLQFVEDYAQKIGDERRPYALETWEKAYEEWSKS
ncbi:MAG: metallophosphoesterase family protein [Lachnospiraceae bacterium]|nr:metallophosphoesterase family protein [Lachnospiraceae bacterium]MBR3508960.1 metallophosphoesterase family protein [Lachnospiraceae bacterium]MBR4604993.1 metallophosphoesterase family protein [Lachnospiraceae bacterium]MBR6150515.1 metallophosphoesterase family protein [Lachnospiraceae bacterium]